MEKRTWMGWIGFLIILIVLVLEIPKLQGIINNIGYFWFFLLTFLAGITIINIILKLVKTRNAKRAKYENCLNICHQYRDALKNREILHRREQVIPNGFKEDDPHLFKKIRKAIICSDNLVRLGNDIKIHNINFGCIAIELGLNFIEPFLKNVKISFNNHIIICPMLPDDEICKVKYNNKISYFLTKSGAYIQPDSDGSCWAHSEILKFYPHPVKNKKLEKLGDPNKVYDVYESQEEVNKPNSEAEIEVSVTIEKNGKDFKVNSKGNESALPTKVDVNDSKVIIYYPRQNSK